MKKPKFKVGDWVIHKKDTRAREGFYNQVGQVIGNTKNYDEETLYDIRFKNEIEGAYIWLSYERYLDSFMSPLKIFLKKRKKTWQNKIFFIYLYTED